MSGKSVEREIVAEMLQQQTLMYSVACAAN